MNKNIARRKSSKTQRPYLKITVEKKRGHITDKSQTWHLYDDGSKRKWGEDYERDDLLMFISKKLLN
ncbi:MAG: hypothetical protein NDI69_09790 [Bacteriovoracaceae bacterium]|nr:hypothetical protein [Bacteriovoracaceae bacterium]